MSATNTNWTALQQAEDMAYFNAGLCCYSPESYSLDEKRDICNEMISTSRAVLDAMRADFDSCPPMPGAGSSTCSASRESRAPSGGGTLRALSERALWHVRSEKARALSPRLLWPSSNSSAGVTRYTGSLKPSRHNRDSICTGSGIMLGPTFRAGEVHADQHGHLRGMRHDG